MRHRIGLAMSLLPTVGPSCVFSLEILISDKNIKHKVFSIVDATHMIDTVALKKLPNQFALYRTSYTIIHCIINQAVEENATQTLFLPKRPHFHPHTQSAWNIDAIYTCCCCYTHTHHWLLNTGTTAPKISPTEHLRGLYTHSLHTRTHSDTVFLISVHFLILISFH